MSHFKIKIEDALGLHESVVEGKDKFAVYRDTKKLGANVISVQEVKEKRRKIEFDFGKITAQDKILFAKNASAMLRAGLTLSRILSVMERQTKKKKLKGVLDSINESVRSGRNFSDALRDHPKHFSHIFISMVKAGEESGNLAESLSILGEQMEQVYLLKKKIKGAMLYPAIVLTIMIIVGVLLMIFIVPTLTATFTELGVELPTSTKIIIGISDLFRYHPVLLLLIAGICASFFVFGKKIEGMKRYIDWLVLRIPVVKNIAKESTSARMARTLSSLLSSGVDFVMALTITADVVENSYHKEIILEAKNRVEKGAPISEVFMQNEHLYPSYVGETMNVGEETGKLAEMLRGVAVYYENEVSQKTKDMSTVIEPVLMVMIGLGVGFFAISMISPTYSVLNNI